jgi:hypothetical protein
MSGAESADTEKPCNVSEPYRNPDALCMTLRHSVHMELGKDGMGRSTGEQRARDEEVFHRGQRSELRYFSKPRCILLK